MFYSSIVLRDDFQFRLIHKKLLERIKQKHNSKIIILLNSRQAKQEYNEYVEKGVINEVKYFEQFDKFSIDRSEAVLERSARLEKTLNMNYNALRMMDRSLGKEFYLGAPNLPNSPGAKRNYLDIINYYNNYLQELMSYLKKHNTDLFIAPSPTDEVVCRSLGIKCRILSTSRIENLWLWSDSHKLKPPNIKRDYLKIKKKRKDW